MSNTTIGCGKTIGFGRRADKCGATGRMRRPLCEECEARADKAYPQGWRSYPGDTCPHGVYTGGCGIDWMCRRCEDGE